MGRSVRGEGILNTSVTYFLPYGGIIQDPNPEEECLQAQVEVDTCYCHVKSAVRLVDILICTSFILYNPMFLFCLCEWSTMTVLVVGYEWNYQQVTM